MQVLRLCDQDKYFRYFKEQSFQKQSQKMKTKPNPEKLIWDNRHTCFSHRNEVHFLIFLLLWSCHPHLRYDVMHSLILYKHFGVSIQNLKEPLCLLGTISGLFKSVNTSELWSQSSLNDCPLRRYFLARVRKWSWSYGRKTQKQLTNQPRIL